MGGGRSRERRGEGKDEDGRMKGKGGPFIPGLHNKEESGRDWYDHLEYAPKRRVEEEREENDDKESSNTQSWTQTNQHHLPIRKS